MRRIIRRARGSHSAAVATIRHGGWEKKNMREEKEKNSGTNPKDIGSRRGTWPRPSRSFVLKKKNAPDKQRRNNKQKNGQWETFFFLFIFVLFGGVNPVAERCGTQALSRICCICYCPTKAIVNIESILFRFVSFCFHSRKQLAETVTQVSADGNLSCWANLTARTPSKHTNGHEARKPVLLLFFFLTSLCVSL